MPAALGGNPELARELFEKGLARTGRKNHMMHVNYARLWAVGTSNREMFRSLLVRGDRGRRSGPCRAPRPTRSHGCAQSVCSRRKTRSFSHAGAPRGGAFDRGGFSARQRGEHRDEASALGGRATLFAHVFPWSHTHPPLEGAMKRTYLRVSELSGCALDRHSGAQELDGGGSHAGLLEQRGERVPLLCELCPQRARRNAELVSDATRCRPGTSLPDGRARDSHARRTRPSAGLRSACGRTRHGAGLP